VRRSALASLEEESSETGSVSDRILAAGPDPNRAAARDPNLVAPRDPNPASPRDPNPAFAPDPNADSALTPVVRPLVSILIVTYKNPDVTRRCLEAVERETAGKSYEVLVLDNASPDGTPEMIAEEFPRLSLDPSVKNLGFARANNELAKRAKGRVLLLLNPDAILHEGAVEALLDLSSRFPEAGIYGGRTLRPSGEVDPSSCWGFQSLWSTVCFGIGLSNLLRGNSIFDPESLGAWGRDSERHVDVVTGCLLLIRANLWRELGGFDEEFWMYGEDQDLAIRAKLAGYRPMITPNAVATHVVGASSRSGEKNVMVLGARVRLMRKHWGTSRTRLGVFLLQCGCGLRAASPRAHVGWRESWRRRSEWTAAGKQS
jgi:N-acetylglucosaminyl-diphospho-decaprenol L-rhamnosyltransferase